MAKYNRVCPVCGKEFIAERKNNIYCSSKCVKKNWQKNNPDKVRESSRKYRENNPDKVRESKKKWRENHSEHIKEYNKNWNENNKERKKEYQKNWCENNKERRKEYQKNWYENNKERKKECYKNWYENKLNKLIKEYSEFKNIPTEDLKWLKKIPHGDRILETEFEYNKFGTASDGYNRHHIIPYKTCIHYRDSHERYSEEWYYWNNKACDFENNGIDLPIEVHKILHSKLNDNGFNKQSIIPLDKFEEYKILTFRLIDEISKELS